MAEYIHVDQPVLTCWLHISFNVVLSQLIACQLFLQQVMVISDYWSGEVVVHFIVYYCSCHSFLLYVSLIVGVKDFLIQYLFSTIDVIFPIG